MKNYTVYDKSTGNILRHLSCHESTALLNVAEGEGILEGYYTSDRFEIVDGSPSEKANQASDDNLQSRRELVISARNISLANSDWTQVPDAPVDQAAWATYRQALRDLPEQEGFPFDITWPVPPRS